MNRTIWVGLLALSLFLTAPAVSAESTGEDIGPVHVDIDWNDTPHCVLLVSRLPCLLGWDQNGTPTDLGDDTFYPYRSIDYLGVDVDPIGPLEGTSFDYSNDEQYVGHHLIDLADSLLKPLEESLPAPVGDWTEYEQGPWYSAVRICLPLEAPDVLGSTCWAVPVEAPFTDRNGTRLPQGANLQGSDTDEFFDEAFRFLDLCWIKHLRYEESVTCDLIPLRDETNQLYRRLTPNFVPGAAANETHVGLMDTVDPPALARDASETPPQAYDAPPVPIDRREWAPLPDLEPAAPLPVTPHRDRHDESTSTPSSAAQPEAQSRAPPAPVPAPSWLLPTAAAAIVAAPIAWALYHRITRERVLLHEARRRLLVIIEQQPGIHLGEASKQLGLTYHTTAHHVRLLRRSGRIEAVRAGRSIALYQVGAVPRHQLRPVAHLRRGPQAEALRLLSHQPEGLGVSDVAARLGCAKSSAHAKLGSLAAQGLVERLPRGRYRATLEGAQALRLLDGDVAASGSGPQTATDVLRSASPPSRGGNGGKAAGAW